MKNILKISVSFLIVFLFSSFVNSQDIGNGEFMIVNKSSSTLINVKIYPVGAIFSGGGQYTVDAQYPVNDGLSGKYLYPSQQYQIDYEESGNIYYIIANFDYTSDIDGCSFSLGYGMYKIEFDDGNPNHHNECIVDFSDANFKGISTRTYYQKLKMFYYNWDDITIQFVGRYASEVSLFNIPSGLIKVWEQYGTSNGTKEQNKGDFNDTVTYHNYPIDASQYGALYHLNPNQFYLNLKIKNQGANTIQNNELYFYNCTFKLIDYIHYSVNTNNNNNVMIISGQGGKFISGYGSEFYSPSGFRILIEDGAVIESNGSYFYSLDPTDPTYYWGGIQMSSPGVSSIKNCEFHKAIHSIASSGSLGKNLDIESNVFYVDYSGGTGIWACFTTNLSILNNTFWLSTNPSLNNEAVIVSNYSSSEEENNLLEENTINIAGNYFYNGNTHLTIDDISSSLSVNVHNNYFYNAAGNIMFFCSSGSFTDNIVYNTYQSTSFMLYGIDMYYSDLDILNNNMVNYGNNIEALQSSHPNLAPIIVDDEVIWTGGMNSLTSINAINISTPIQIYAPGYFYTDYGNNNFDIENAYSLHFDGNMDTYDTKYGSNENCWFVNSNNGDPIYSLINNDNLSMTVVHTPPPLGCSNKDFQIKDKIITNKKHRIHDTIIVTRLNNPQHSSKENTFYGIGVKNKLQENYSSAILNFKDYIDSYPDSKYTENALFKLFECCVSSDTKHNQGWRNSIFGDLKNYLESKIQQNNNNDKFMQVAYNFLLKCNVKLKCYKAAMDGFAFIADNSPYASDRLMASLNYIDVEGLIQGNGGGKNDNNENNFELSSNINGKTIKEILLTSYDKTRKSIIQKENLDLQNSNDVNRTKFEQDKIHTREKILENRAIENIGISGTLNKEARRERIHKDIMLLTSHSLSSDNFVKSDNSSPFKYELSQNYPNPFNPVTNIKYQIQKLGFVTLKIYDITGREVKTLVNEIKNPGNYSVTFNGSELSSGVYFYRIQAGDFIQVKKMVLIK
jgi:hypothetical protein